MHRVEMYECYSLGPRLSPLHMSMGREAGNEAMNDIIHTSPFSTLLLVVLIHVFNVLLYIYVHYRSLVQCLIH